ncbi:hypothetical protein GW17_00059347 [Ensete ventricosum]|nr:hypothetical protein GW17_00059347 [Ensete ventricosum]
MSGHDRFRPVCANSPVIVLAERRWSTVEWWELSGQARQRGSWLVGRTTADPSIPVSGQLHCVGSATLAVWVIARQVPRERLRGPITSRRKGPKRLGDRMDLGDLQGMPKMPGGKALVARSVGSTQGVGGVPPIEVPKPSSKRPYGPPVPSDDPSRRHKKVKILSRKHKSRCGEEGSRLHSKGKEPAEPVEEPEMLGDSVEEDVSPVFHRPRSMKDLFKTKVHKDDTGYYALHISKTVAKVEERASELEKELEKTKRKQDEALQRLEASDRELNKVRSNLSEIQRLLKEAWVRAQKMDDELL